jgi:hypothetical protein
MNGAHHGPLFSCGVQSVHRAGTAAVDSRLPGTPPEFGSDPGDSVIGSGDKDHIGTIDQLLSPFINPAPGNIAGKSLRCLFDHVEDADDLIATLRQVYRKGGAHRSGADKSEF